MKPKPREYQKIAIDRRVVITATGRSVSTSWQFSPEWRYIGV